MAAILHHSQESGSIAVSSYFKVNPRFSRPIFLAFLFAYMGLIPTLRLELVSAIAHKAVKRMGGSIIFCSRFVAFLEIPLLCAVKLRY
jgi:hypothetical protein